MEKMKKSVRRKVLRKEPIRICLKEVSGYPKGEVATMAVPTMISMLVVVIYNIADTFLLARPRIHAGCGCIFGNTGIYDDFMALGNLFGIGGSSAISRALGENIRNVHGISVHFAVMEQWDWV